MNIQAKQLNIVRKILNTKNENTLDLINETIESQKSKDFTNEFKPMSIEEFKLRIDSSIDDYNNDRLIDVEDLEKEIEEWV